MTKQLFFSLLVLFTGTALTAQNRTFQPGKIWHDTNGHHINAHAGGFLFHEGTYYWFGQIMIPGKRGSDA